MDSSWKKMILGEPMPDRDDPKYRERYLREVQAGRRFAQRSGISWLAGVLQLYGQSHRKAFLAIVFGFVLTLTALNTARLVSAYSSSRGGHPMTAVERVDSALHSRRHLSPEQEIIIRK